MQNKVEIPLNQLKVSRASKLHDVSSRSTAVNATVLDESHSLKRVGITTLGCKVNTYESELISEAFKGDGWVSVPSKEEADMYIINTCTVTNEADKQARREVRKVVKRNPEALVVVTGCYAQIEPQACAEIPGVDFVVGNDRKMDMRELLPKLKSGELPPVIVGDLDEHVSLPQQVLTSFEAHTRAFIQIQQGCDQGCTFCIIHVARGPGRSIPLTLIRRQVERLAINDYPEIVICGVDLGSYGEDFPVSENRPNLVALIKEIISINVHENPNFRIRLSSIDPVHISDELIELFGEEPRLCGHIHLSLQSGSTLILKRMKRRYDREFVYERIKKLRKKLPKLVISADVMVGFPTETEQDFLATEQALVDLDIAYPHVFSYSIREGTPAARIPSAKQIPVEIKKQRSMRLRKIAEGLQLDLLERRLGTHAWVLPESDQGDSYKSRSEDYLTVKLIKGEDVFELGQWVRVEYTGFADGIISAIALH